MVLVGYRNTHRCVEKVNGLSEIDSRGSGFWDNKQQQQDNQEKLTLSKGLLLHTTGFPLQAIVAHLPPRGPASHSTAPVRFSIQSHANALPRRFHVGGSRGRH